MEKLGVALLGLDHWYSAFHIAPAVADSPYTRLVAISHDDEAKARKAAQEYGAELATTDYRAALDRPDVDIVVTLYSTDRNVEICREAAALGKHIVSVKPLALDLAGADAIVAAVKAAGVQFFPLECQRRLSPEWVQIKSWIDSGRIGQPLRFNQMLYGSLPQAWPGSKETGWWTEPTRTPGGGWIDHAIYAIDLARWLLDAEPVQVAGMAGNQRHADLAVEDYGLATYAFSNGALAFIENTWTVDRGAGFSRMEIIGAGGAIIEDSTMRGALALRGEFGLGGAISLDVKRDPRSPIVDHMAAVVRGEAAPAATVDDGRANLAACLAFYQAAREGKQLAVGG